MDELASAFETTLVGRTCRLRRREADWAFDLENGVSLAVQCHWRLISSDKITVTDEDDGQKFGRPKPVDAERVANDLLTGTTIASARIDRVTADLCLRFNDGIRLEVFNNSSGYEGWQANFDHAGKTALIVALGGGGLTFS